MIGTQLEKLKVYDIHAQEPKSSIKYTSSATLVELSQSDADPFPPGNNDDWRLSRGTLANSGHKEFKSFLVKLEKESIPQKLTATLKSSHKESKNEDNCLTEVKSFVQTQGSSNPVSKEEFSPSPLQDINSTSKIQNKEINPQQRKAIMDKLSEKEQKKFALICEAVAKRGWSYPLIFIIQCLIVSHFDIKEALRRMKKWSQTMKKWKASEVSRSAALEYIKANISFSSIGGLDPEGRRVYVIHFGNVVTSEVWKNFPTFCRYCEVLWDTLTINVPEMRAGLSIVADLKGFGAANWSIPLFIRFIGMAKDKYPVRIRRIYFVNTPGFFSVVSRLVMMILPKKFKKRILVLSNKSLQETIGITALPVELGGTYEKAGPLWFEKRLKERYGNP